MRSKNFSFEFTKNIGKFIILRKDIEEVRRSLCKVYGVCLDM